MDSRPSFLDSKAEILAPRCKNLSLLGLMGTAISIMFLLSLILSDPRLNTNIINDTQYELWIEEFEQLVNMQSCKSNPLLGSNKTHIWIERDNMRHYNLTSSSKFSCCYRSFYRLTPSLRNTEKILSKKHVIKYSNCIHFTNNIKVNDEFVRVTCTNTATLFDTFYVFVPEKVPTTNANLPYNVLILGIDGVSRLNFHRMMPKTVGLLKKLGAVELLGYNKVADNTFPNLIPLLMGITEQDLEETCLPCKLHPFDGCPFIWKQYQKAGFLTALAEDISHLGTFTSKRGGFVKTPTDYYLNPFIAEAEKNAANNKNDFIMLCMNEKFFFKLLLDYVEDLTAFKHKLFGFFWECSMTHHNLFFPMVMDDSYSEFFNRLNTSGYLSDSIIFVVSDHGIRFGAFRQTKQGFLEERLPLAFLLMPPSFRDNFDVAYNNLKLNSHHLTTPFDMHATLADLVNLDNVENKEIISRSRDAHLNRGISLFLPISGKRTCKSAGIDAHWCICYRNVKLRLDNADGKDAVSHTISHLNRILEGYPQCSKLSLGNILEVTQLKLPEKLNKGSIELIVKFRTVPGGGILEATLARENLNGTWKISGTVSRLNFYGNQSYCVSDSHVVMYCYCLNLTRDSFYENETVNISIVNKNVV